MGECFGSLVSEHEMNITLEEGDGAGLQPLMCLCRATWGDAPGWYGVAPLALKQARRSHLSKSDYKGAFIISAETSASF
jgi:hypothetical protein